MTLENTVNVERISQEIEIYNGQNLCKKQVSKFQFKCVSQRSSLTFKPQLFHEK